MKRRKFLVSLLLALLMLPLHVFAEEPTYAFTDAEVLARGQLYYSSLKFSKHSLWRYNRSD